MVIESPKLMPLEAAKYALEWERRKKGVIPADVVEMAKRSVEWHTRRKA